MRILLLSAYPAESHRRWQRGIIQAFPEFDWVLMELPPRFFAWRSRGNSLTWGMGNYPELDESYDLLLATSMVDLSALRGFRPALARLPTIVYFHENQFAYPVLTHQKGRLELQMTGIYTALVADALVFNSDFNRETFLSGSADLLKSMPDGIPSHIFSQLESRSQVLPVPLEDSCWRKQPFLWRSGKARLDIVWNHRWEQDKNPNGLLLALRHFFSYQKTSNNEDVSVCVHVVGQQFRQQPPVFAELKSLLEQNKALGQWGFVSSLDEYNDLLHQCDLVLSTAWHDFQGLSVLEAVAAGCFPLVPNRLVYPEWFPAHSLYHSYPDQPEKEAEALAQAIAAYCSMAQQAVTTPVALKSMASKSTSAKTWVKQSTAQKSVQAIESEDITDPSTLSASVKSFKWQHCKKQYGRLFHQVIRRGS